MDNKASITVVGPNTIDNQILVNKIKEMLEEEFRVTATVTDYHDQNVSVENNTIGNTEWYLFEHVGILENTSVTVKIPSPFAPPNGVETGAKVIRPLMDSTS